MKVRDLIADSRFTPGFARDSVVPPRVTIILPTFRRGDSGLLKGTIDSVLGQSFEDFELIIIDDASTDSSAAVIAEAMKRDPRVSVIRHAHNIGLPAVSEYEGYVLARGDLITFAFDDTVMYRHGLRRLVRESERYPGALIAGYVKAFFRTARGTVYSSPLGLGIQEEDLLARNVIPNNAVLGPKAIFDEVGLYDPHVSVARLCDYDLWLRVRRRFPIRIIATCIGEEYGPSTYDSLGHTYTLDDWTTDDRMRQRRNHLLTPHRFADIDVFDVTDFESARSRGVVTTLVDRHLSTREWMSPALDAPTPPARVPRILVLAAGIGASTQLYFEGLRDVPGVHVRIIDPRSRTFTELTEADVLVVVRHLHYNSDWLQVAQAAAIPVFFFLDDNMPLMAARRELDFNRTAEFNLDRLREDTRQLDGILTSTDRLAESFRKQGLHSSVSAIQLVVPGAVAEWRARRTRVEDQLPTLALFVGPHRLRDLRRVLWPALVGASRRADRRLRLLVPETSLRLLKRLPDRDRVEIVPFPTSSDYFVALRTLNELGTDIIVVPSTRTVNAEFKALHPLLSAAALGASLLAPATEPYLELRSEQGVLLVSDHSSQEHWESAFLSAIGGIGSDMRAGVGLLTQRFDPIRGADRLLAAIAHALPEDKADEHVRLRRIADWLVHQVLISRATPQFSPSLETSGTVALATQLQTTLRTSRQLHLFRGASRQLPGFQFAGLETVQHSRSERIELSTPLTGLPYLSYRMSIPRGRYRRLSAMVWADGMPGDLIGIEIVNPEGQISLHTVTSMPREEHPVRVSFNARQFRVEHDELHEVRVFGRTSQLAFVLERVDRGRLGLRQPRVTPVLQFER